MADQARWGVDVVDRQGLAVRASWGKGELAAFRYIRNDNDPALFSISYSWGNPAWSQDGWSALQADVPGRNRGRDPPSRAFAVRRQNYRTPKEAYQDAITTAAA